MISILDYGSGNLQNLINAIKYIGADFSVATNPQDLLKADKIMIPGVGSFKAAIRNLETRNLVATIKKKAQEGAIVFGVCVGMQILFEQGFEDGQCDALNLIKGNVVKLAKANKIPQMGWNNIEIKNSHPLIKNISNNDWFYFIHSYHCLAEANDTIAECQYFEKICAIVAKDNIWGVQFHPEKSQEPGLQLLKNFIEY